MKRKIHGNTGFQQETSKAQINNLNFHGGLRGYSSEL